MDAGFTETEPESGCDPDHAPVAVQETACVVDHESVLDDPCGISEGVAAIDTVATDATTTFADA